MRALFSVALLGYLAAPAIADSGSIDLRDKPTTPEALAKEREAKRLYEIGETNDAIETYKAGYLIEPSARFLFNLAVVSNATGRHEEAINWIAKLKNKFRNLNKESRDAVERLLVDAKQKRKAQEEVSNKPKLQRKQTPTHKTEPDLSPPAVRRTTETPYWHRDVVGWTLLGVGVASATGGGLTLANAKNLRDEGNRNLDEAERTKLRDRADTRQTLGVVALGIGGAALIAGVVKLVLVPDAPQSLALTPGAEGVVATFSTTW